MSTETYQKILVSARSLFLQQGYTATSIRQIAEATGIGKATIYHHFPDKLAILRTLLQQKTQQVQLNMADILAETDPPRRIEMVTRNALRFFYETADILQLIRREVPELRQEMYGSYSQFIKTYRSLLEETIQAGINSGQFRPVDPSDAVRVLLTLIQGTFAMTFMNSDKTLPSEDALDLLLDIYFQGINQH